VKVTNVVQTQDGQWHVQGSWDIEGDQEEIWVSGSGVSNLKFHTTSTIKLGKNLSYDGQGRLELGGVPVAKKVGQENKGKKGGYWVDAFIDRIEPEQAFLQIFTKSGDAPRINGGIFHFPKGTHSVKGVWKGANATLVFGAPKWWNKGETPEAGMNISLFSDTTLAQGSSVIIKDHGPHTVTVCGKPID
jgi:hypothetical protein